jgi:hypothetical protein
VKSDADGDGELAEADDSNLAEAANCEIAEADEFFTPSPWPDPSCAVKQTAGALKRFGPVLTHRFPAARIIRWYLRASVTSSWRVQARLAR